LRWHGDARLVCGICGGAGLRWAEVQVNRGESPFGIRIPVAPMKKYLPWVDILASHI
jgi:hypothetical protein